MTDKEIEDLRFIVNVLLFLFSIILLLQLYFFGKQIRSFLEGIRNVITFFGEKDVQLPHRSKALQAGIDLKFHRTTVIQQDSIKEIDLCLGVQIPKNHFGWVTLRSSAKNRRIIVHAGAIIDEYFTGYIRVYLWNLSKTESYVLERGKSMLQLLVLPCHQGITRLVHSTQLKWTREHVELRTGSSGNVHPENSLTTEMDLDASTVSNGASSLRRRD